MEFVFKVFLIMWALTFASWIFIYFCGEGFKLFANLLIGDGEKQ
tara:strand:+ start:139 stop:270 length:132 start_codon:yes stop_codon:yes gene_type:complete